MDAHQVLAAPIPIANCREIAVEIENRDNKQGTFTLGIQLTDSTTRRRQTLDLGQQPILSTEPDRFYLKGVPVDETLRFPLPPKAEILQFNEITVQLVPDFEHALAAPKIAVRQFQLQPR